MKHEMESGESDKNTGKDGAAKTGGGDLTLGLSSRSGLGGYAKGDAMGDTTPKGGSAPHYKVKKAGKTFEVC